MKISRPRPTSRKAPQAQKELPKIGTAGAYAVSPLSENPFIQSSSANPAIFDSVEIAGIPGNELTPKVQKALINLLELVDELKSEITTLEGRVIKAEARADMDPLLNIANRRSFGRDLSRTLAMVKRYDHKATLLFLDLNNLKKINDSHGHAAGDAALEHFATTISKNIRVVDRFARIGGDEFGIILEKADKNIARQKITQLAEILGNTPLNWQGSSIVLRFASGLVTITGENSAEEVLQLADQAMYEDKIAAGSGRQS